MSKLILNKQTLADIADAVREKTGSEDLIAIEDLDDAVKHISGGNGGGIVEVDELPKPYLCTPVPNSGYIEKVYFDTSLSIEQVIVELEKLTFIDGGCGLLLNDNTLLLVMIQDDGIYLIVDSSNNILYFASGDTSGTGQVSIGWNPDFNGEIEVNSEVRNEGWYSIGAENDKIANLFYLDKQPNPKINAEAIYKLPDETLWMWSNDKFIQLGEKLSPMELGTANNPEFGFYYGQIFSLDDPITFDIPVLAEEMNKLSLTEFSLFNGNVLRINIPVHDTYGGYVELSELRVDCSMYQEGEMSVRLHNTDGYRELDYKYIVGLTESLTFTIRQLYKNAYAELRQPMDAETVDRLLERFPLKFGMVEPSYSNTNVNSGLDNWWTQGDLNNPENAIFKFLKIGK